MSQVESCVGMCFSTTKETSRDKKTSEINK